MKMNKRDLVEMAKRGDLTGLQGLVGSRDLKNKGLALQALIGAARQGKRSCVRFLLDHCDAKGLAQEGKTALMAAALNDQAAVVELLLPVSHSQAQDRAGNIALLLAAKGASPGCIRLLLPWGGALHRNGAGRTALMLAAEAGSLEGTRLLMGVSDVKACDAQGGNAVSLAGAGAHWSIVELLAPSSSRASVDCVFAQAGHENMPKWNARLEREQLQKELAVSAADTASSTKATPLARPPRRL